MAGDQGIARELSIGELVSKTFNLYQRDFMKYLILFLVVETLIGIFTTLVAHAIVLPAIPPVNATPDQILTFLPTFFGAVIALIALTVVVTLVFLPLAIGSTVRMVSDAVQTGRADLEASVRFAVSKLVPIWALSIIVAIIVGLGLIALIVPGVILAIMFCLALPVLLIENPGVLESLGRSRKLVSQRWLKTFATFLVFGIIFVIASAVVSAISAPFGVASTVVSSILSAFYLPLIPIALTVYYYSNAARIAPPQMGQAQMPTAPSTMAPMPPMTPAATFPGGVKYCLNCGTQLPSAATFCSKCGARQPT